MTTDAPTQIAAVRAQVRLAIEEYIELPLYANDSALDFLVPPGSRRPRDIHKWAKGLEGSFGWVAGDPSSAKVKNASRLLYESEPADHHASVPNVGKVPCLTLLDRLTADNAQKDVFLIGARGSGKSSAQNDLINHPDDNFFKRGFTFFRADVAKLHHFNVMELDATEKLKERITIAEYMMVHSFFVAFRKGNAQSADPAMCLFAEDAKAAQAGKYSPVPVGTLFQRWIEDRAQVEADRFNALWTAVVWAFRARGNDKKHDRDLYTFLKKWRGVDPSLREFLPALFEIFLEFIVGVDELALARPRVAKIVWIVDGVDNLRIDEYRPVHMGNGAGTSREWYRKYLDDLKEMTSGRLWPNLIHKTLFAIRPDTAEDLGAIDAHVNLSAVGSASGSRTAADHVVVVCPPNISKMTDRKRLAARDHSVDALYIESIGDSDASRSAEYSEQVPEMHKWFETFVPLFVEAHLQTLKECDQPHNSARDVLRIVFNDNVRSYSRNLIYTFSAVYDAAFKKCQTGYVTDLKKREAEFCSTVAAIAFEVSVTAGAPYFPENSDDTINGRWCPNLFEFVLTEGSNRWNGLVMLRLLQALPIPSSTQRPLRTTEIVALLATMGYPKVLVERATLYAVEFGLIFKRDTLLTASGMFEPLYATTEKGTYIRKLPFCSAAVLYLMSTGCRFAPSSTPPPSQVKALLDAHWIHHRDSESRAFWAAALKSGTYLLRHIVNAHEMDKSTAGAALDPRFAEIPMQSVLLHLTNGAAGLRGSPGIEAVLLDLVVQSVIKKKNEGTMGE